MVIIVVIIIIYLYNALPKINHHYYHIDLLENSSGFSGSISNSFNVGSVPMTQIQSWKYI